MKHHGKGSNFRYGSVPILTRLDQRFRGTVWARLPFFGDFVPSLFVGDFCVGRACRILLHGLLVVIVVKVFCFVILIWGKGVFVFIDGGLWYPWTDNSSRFSDCTRRRLCGHILHG